MIDSFTVVSANTILKSEFQVRFQITNWFCLLKLLEMIVTQGGILFLTISVSDFESLYDVESKMQRAHYTLYDVII